MLTKFMKMFIEPEVLKKKNICDIDVKDSNNCLSVKEVKIGIEIQELVNASKAKPLENLTCVSCIESYGNLDIVLQKQRILLNS